MDFLDLLEPPEIRESLVPLDLLDLLEPVEPLYVFFFFLKICLEQELKI